jgi:uridine kinase
LGIVDWDDPGSWDSGAAMAALIGLCTQGRAEVPIYDISADGPIGTRTVEVGQAPFVAEGLFAAELYPACTQAGILLDAIVVHRSRWKNLVRRAARDLRERRKPPVTIMRRGVGLYQREDAIVARALRAGFRSLDAVQTRQALTAWLGQ